MSLLLIRRTIVMKNSDDKKKRNVGCLCGLIILIAILAIMVVLITSEDDSTEEKTSGNANTSTTQKESEKDYPVIYEDDYVKASFIKVYSDALVNTSVQGVAYMQLHVENKSNQTFTVGMTKAAINGKSTTIGSGVPMTILPGNTSEQPFILFTNNTGVNNADEIKEVQFSFFLLDENTNKLEETKTITINIK